MSASTLPFPSGSKLKVSNGPLSSGEGLVHAVRDGSDDENDDDRGVTDKRLLVVEQELGAALRAFQRSGNNLSMILRMAFDGGTVEPLTKNNRTIATDPHINVLGHITRQELDSLLTATEIWNGLGNRFHSGSWHAGPKWCPSRSRCRTRRLRPFCLHDFSNERDHLFTRQLRLAHCTFPSLQTEHQNNDSL
jgi:hypothetical protein